MCMLKVVVSTPSLYTILKMFQQCGIFLFFNVSTLSESLRRGQHVLIHFGFYAVDNTCQLSQVYTQWTTRVNTLGFLRREQNVSNLPGFSVLDNTY